MSTAVLGLLMSSGLLGDAGLRVSPRPGQVFHYQVVEQNRTESTLSGAASAQVDETETTTEYELAVVGKEAKGFRVRLTKTRLKVSGTVSQLRIDYDSARGDPPPTVKQHPAYLATKSLGLSIDFLVDDVNAVSEVHGADRIIDLDLRDLPNQDLLRSIVTPEAIARELVAEMFVPIPRWTPRVGSTWSAQTRYLGNLGLEVQTRMTYELVSATVAAGVPVMTVRIKSVPVLQASNGFQEAVHMKMEWDQSKTLQIDIGSGMVLATDESVTTSVSFSGTSGNMEAGSKHSSRSQKRAKLLEVR